MRYALLLVMLLRAHADACTEDPDFDSDHDEPCVGPYQPWSWAPLVTGAIAYDGHTAALWSAELRLRHNPDDDPDPMTLSLGVSSRSFATLEPYAMVGHDYLGDLCELCDSALGLHTDLHVGLGAGANIHGAGFALARMSFGIMYDINSGARPEYEGGENPGWSSSPRRRHHSQVDIVVEGKLGLDGELRVAVGLEIDPFRWVIDQLTMQQH